MKQYSLQRFKEIRSAFPYGIKIIDENWYLIDRDYKKVSRELNLSDDILTKISNISKELKGSYIENKNGNISGIWFYDDALKKELENKGYFEEFSNKID